MLLAQQFRARSGCQELGTHHLHIRAGSSRTGKKNLASLPDAAERQARLRAGTIEGRGRHDDA